MKITNTSPTEIWIYSITSDKTNACLCAIKRTFQIWDAKSLCFGP